MTAEEYQTEAERITPPAQADRLALHGRRQLERRHRPKRAASALATARRTAHPDGRTGAHDGAQRMSDEAPKTATDRRDGGPRHGGTTLGQPHGRTDALHARRAAAPAADHPPTATHRRDGDRRNRHLAPQGGSGRQTKPKPREKDAPAMDHQKNEGGREMMKEEEEIRRKEEER